MKIPPEITYRGVDKTEAIDNLIQQKIAKLERICDYINSCRIAVEKVHDRPRSGSPYRVRIDMTVPPSHELVVDNDPEIDSHYEPLETTIRKAFEIAERHLKKLSRQQRESDRGKIRSSEDTMALVTQLFPDKGYGFMRTLDGQEIFFHRHSVLNHDFDRLEIGTGVRFVMNQDEESPHASTVKIIDKPGANAGKSNQSLIEPPVGW
jgi:cold shock CspA family protein/ribosome-associated translation inhibitor RaiA